MNNDRALLATGVIGAVIALLCCLAPVLAVVFGGLGLTAWLAGANYIVLLALAICLALLMFGLTRRWRARR